MLKRAEEADRRAIERFCSGSLPGAYLECRLRCYGFGYGFVKFWFAEEKGEVTAVIGALEDSAVLLASPDADHSELAAFLRMVPFSSVMTAAKTAERCGFRGFKIKQSLVFRGAQAASPAVQPEDMKTVYDLISREIPGSFSRETNAYLSFLSDFTFRQNRGFARARALFANATLCACALTAAETPSSAVLSGVAADPRFRGRGNGRRVVLSLANELKAEGKTVYVIALNYGAAAFYRHIGFEDLQPLAMIERTSYV